MSAAVMSDSFEENLTLMTEEREELVVTFNPPLYLQRQQWLLNILTREKVRSVLDIGCGEGNLLQCLSEPSIAFFPLEARFQTSDELYIHTVHGLDPSPQDLEYTLKRTAPAITTSSIPNSTECSNYTWRLLHPPRWTPLQVHLWNGGFENLNYDVFGGDKIDAFVATEVIEHLTPELFPLFAPALLGYYRPRLVLFTTPNYTYNQRFHPPDEPPLTGYPDPTGRTDRVFRHHDHRFEWTAEEWTAYCTKVAAEYGYEVEVGGIGKAVEPDPWNRENIIGYATQLAVFRRMDDRVVDIPPIILSTLLPQARKPDLVITHILLPHPLSSEELSIPPNQADIYKAVQEALLDNLCKSLSIREIWRNWDVALACKGDVRHLLQAFRVGSFDDGEWEVKDDTVENGWKIEITWNRFELPPEREVGFTPVSDDEDVMVDYNDDVEPEVDWYTYQAPVEKDVLNITYTVDNGWAVPGDDSNWSEVN